MNRIYLDATVMTQPTGVGAAGTTAALPGAAEALGHLADEFELVVLGAAPRSVLDALKPSVAAAGAMPEAPAHGSWLITDDPESCLNRPPGLRTILIGGRRAPTNKPTPRCDIEARDLNAAVVEILTRSAMAT